MSSNKKKVLGKGLDALLGSPLTDITSTDISGNYVAGAIADIPVSQIEANPFQPRESFEQKELDELADSIREQGIITPITVRKMGYDQYQIISGERRFRASILAGMTKIPAFVRIANDQQMLEMALIENIQRKDLNAIEVSIGFQRLVEECGLTQEELSQRVGKDRATVTNYLRLLKLPPEIQVAVRDNKISMGHARALISVDDVEQQKLLLQEIFDNALSVRQVEEMVRDIAQRPLLKKQKKAKKVRPQEIITIEKELSNTLKTAISVNVNHKGKGNISIAFKSHDDLNRIVHYLHSINITGEV